MTPEESNRRRSLRRSARIREIALWQEGRDHAKLPDLAMWAVPVPARVIDVPGRAAVLTAFDVTAEDRRATGKDRTPDAGCPARQRLAGELSLAEGGQHPGQAGRFHRRRSAGREQFERRGGTG